MGIIDEKRYTIHMKVHDIGSAKGRRLNCKLPDAYKMHGIMMNTFPDLTYLKVNETVILNSRKVDTLHNRIEDRRERIDVPETTDKDFENLDQKRRSFWWRLKMKLTRKELKKIPLTTEGD